MSGDTIEAWVLELLTTTTLAGKLAPAPPPRAFAEVRPAPQRLLAPSRPRELRAATGRIKAPRRGALAHPQKRAQLFHGFLHHELQAAELFGWAILAFPESPPAFRRGLLRILLDELRHVRAYEAHLHGLGFAVGDFEINDWFWRRVPTVTSPGGFLAVMGLGLESANLDHAERYVAVLRAVGDEAGAALQAQIAREERPHVAFATRWFPRFEGALDFDTWRRALPPPLSPLLMRGASLARTARLEAGWTPALVNALEAWTPGA